MNVCRLCLCTNLVRNHVFDEGSSLYKKMLYLPIQIHKKDELPQKICDKCITKLDICYEFCKIAIDSQNMFLSNLNKYKKNCPKLQKSKSHQSTQTDNDFISVKIENNYYEDNNFELELKNNKSNDDDYESEIETNKINVNDYIEVAITNNRSNANDDPLDVIKIENDLPNNSEELNIHEKQAEKEIVKSTASKRKHVDFNYSDDDDDTEGFDGQLDWNMLSELRNKVKKTKRQLIDTEIIHLNTDESNPGEIDVNNEWTCCICLVYKAPIKKLLQHYQMHGSQEKVEENIAPIKLSDAQLRCPLCSMLFRSQEYYENHYTYEHKSVPYQCLACCMICKGPKEALEHGLTHNFNQDLSPVVHTCMCDHCPKRFLNNQYLLKHRKRVHPTASKIIKYRCMECTSTFKNITTLATHRRSHTKELVFPCVICGKVLSSNEKYKLHMRGHTGYSPHVCRLCGESFKRSDTLRSHMRTHTGSKPYVCTTCHKGFSQRSAMVVHQRCHTGLKPYLCDSCGKNFQTQALLTSHRNANKCSIAANFVDDQAPVPDYP